MANIYNAVMDTYGYDSNIFHSYAHLVLIWSFESQVKKEIKEIILSLSDR